jgi:hypothetical protein
MIPPDLSWITPFDIHVSGFRNRARSSALHRTTNLEDQVAVFVSVSDRVAQLYTQAPSFLFFALCDPQGDCGGVLTRLHSRYVLEIFGSNHGPQTGYRDHDSLVVLRMVKLWLQGERKYSIKLRTADLGIDSYFVLGFVTVQSGRRSRIFGRILHSPSLWSDVSQSETSQPTAPSW